MVIGISVTTVIHKNPIAVLGKSIGIVSSAKGTVRGAMINIDTIVIEEEPYSNIVSPTE
jgi:hypothetical protein